MVHIVSDDETALHINFVSDLNFDVARVGLVGGFHARFPGLWSPFRAQTSPCGDSINTHG